MIRMNLRRIIDSTHRYNFHAHTQFCDGRDTLAQIADAAADAGFEHFGFTPHSPIPIASPCNMSAADIDTYRAEVEAANARHAGRCRFYYGMEIDYLGDLSGASSPFFTDLGLDYSIGSVHFIRNQRGEYVDIDGHFDSFRKKMAECFDNDIRYVVEEFYRASAEMLTRGGFDILGHFDKIGQNASYYTPGIEDEPWYQALVGGYISQIIDSGIIVEINTKAKAEHDRFFPNRRYWPRLVAAGVPLMINSDAHYASRIDASRQDAFEWLEKV